MTAIAFTLTVWSLLWADYEFRHAAHESPTTNTEALKMRHMRHSPVRGPAQYPSAQLVVVREMAEMDRDFALFMLELFHGPDHVFMVDYFCDMIQNADMVVRECEKALKPKTIGDTVTFRDDCEGSK